MKRLDSHVFRKAIASQTEPVLVTKYGKPLGTWIPAGHVVLTEQPAQPASESVLAAAIRLLLRAAENK